MPSAITMVHGIECLVGLMGPGIPGAASNARASWAPQARWNPLRAQSPRRVIRVARARSPARSPVPTPVRERRYRIPLGCAGGRADRAIHQQAVAVFHQGVVQERQPGFLPPALAQQARLGPWCWHASRYSGVPRGSPRTDYPDHHPQVAAIRPWAASCWRFWVKTVASKLRPCGPHPGTSGRIGCTRAPHRRRARCAPGIERSSSKVLNSRSGGTKARPTDAYMQSKVGESRIDTVMVPGGPFLQVHNGQHAALGIGTTAHWGLPPFLDAGILTGRAFQ